MALTLIPLGLLMLAAALAGKRKARRNGIS
jgi:hypothetical protein